MPRLDFHPGVFDELNEAYHWYQAQKKDLGERFFQDLDDAFKQIQTTPKFWPLADFGMRKFVLKKFPYSILYPINQDHFKVLAVMHQRRKPGYWKDRLS